MKIAVLLTVALMISFSTIQAQKVKWKKAETKSKVDLYLFHSTQVANFPTAETIGKNDFEFEISHRFRGATSSGIEDFFGTDLGANMRIAFAYGFSDHFMMAMARSNVTDNYDTWVKYRLFQIDNDLLPSILAVRVGTAWNAIKTEDRDRTDTKNVQYYAQLVYNTMIAKKLGIGFVPSYLYNSHIFCVDKEYSFTFGTYLQYYVGKLWSVFVELNPTVSGWRSRYNSVSLGVELETGGHFFKMFLGNNTTLNPSQFLAGAPDYSFNDGDLVFGFNITRILSFWK